MCETASFSREGSPVGCVRHHHGGISPVAKEEETVLRAISLLVLWLILGMRLVALAEPWTFKTIDFLGATNTEAMGISPSGDIVGRYRSADGLTHGSVQ
jgi:hypothetical protein